MQGEVFSLNLMLKYMGSC